MDNFNIAGTINAFKNAFPSITNSIDDVIYLTFGQWTNLLSEKQKIKHEKSLKDFKLKIYEEASKIPEKSLKTPDISILGPTLEASKFYIEDSTLREMFAKVSASSIDKRVKNYSRAAFVEFIKQLSPIDIKLIYQLKGDMKVGVSGESKTLTISGPNKLPIMDINIVKESKRVILQSFQDNVVPDSICDALNCSYHDLAASIDNLTRLGIITKKNGEIMEWRMMKAREWFENNAAISDAYNEINNERKVIKKKINLRDHPYTTKDYKNGKEIIIKHMNSYNEDLDKELVDNTRKKVKCNYKHFIQFTSLGEDFVDVCIN